MPCVAYRERRNYPTFNGIKNTPLLKFYLVFCDLCKNGIVELMRLIFFSNSDFIDPYGLNCKLNLYGDLLYTCVLKFVSALKTLELFHLQLR